MATLTASKKTARLDLRLTQEQKEEIELAADLGGISLSQWSIEKLLTSARETINRSTHTVLSDEDFDAFASALERPMNPKLKAFVSEKTIWE